MGRNDDLPSHACLTERLTARRLPGRRKLALRALAALLLFCAASMCAGPSGHSGEQTTRSTTSMPSKLRQSFAGHEAEIKSVAVTPDGQRVLSGTRCLRFWNAKTGRQLWRRRDPHAFVLSVCISPNGSRAASTYANGLIRIWELTTGKELCQCKGHEGEVDSAVFFPKGRRLLSGGRDKTLRIWDAQTGRQLKVLRGHENPIMSVAISPDGKSALSCSALGKPDGPIDHSVRLWDTEKARQIRQFCSPRLGEPRMRVTFSPDGRLAVAAGYRPVWVWRIDDGKLLRTINTGMAIMDMAISKDGARLLTAGMPRPLHDDQETEHPPETVKLWDLATGEKLESLQADRIGTRAVAFMPDGAAAVTGGSDNVVRIWRLPKP